MTQVSDRATNQAQVKAIRDMLIAMMSNADAQPSLEARRAGYDAWGLAYPLSEDASCDAISLGGVPADMILVRGAEADTALLYLHGGGYGIGSAQSHRHLVGQLCDGTGLVGYNVSYRLAPETQFPGAVDDALMAYRALLDLGFPAHKIMIAGDSAGGGLTVACALAIKKAALPQPAGLYVMSPWVNLTQKGESYGSKADVDFIVTKAALDEWAHLYLGTTDPKTPLASPVFGDLSGLAPLMIQVGSEEVLLSDSLALAQAAGLAKVDVTLAIAPDMPHVYPYMWANVDEGRRAIEAACIWMKARLG